MPPAALQSSTLPPRHRPPRPQNSTGCSAHPPPARRPHTSPPSPLPSHPPSWPRPRPEPRRRNNALCSRPPRRSDRHSRQRPARPHACGRRVPARLPRACIPARAREPSGAGGECTAGGGLAPRRSATPPPARRAPGAHAARPQPPRRPPRWFGLSRHEVDQSPPRPFRPVDIATGQVRPDQIGQDQRRRQQTPPIGSFERSGCRFEIGSLRFRRLGRPIVLG